VFKSVWRLCWKINVVCMSLSPFDSFQSRFVTYWISLVISTQVLFRRSQKIWCVPITKTKSPPHRYHLSLQFSGTNVQLRAALKMLTCWLELCRSGHQIWNTVWRHFKVPSFANSCLFLFVINWNTRGKNNLFFPSILRK